MTSTDRPVAPWRHHREPQRAGLVELLYDVVFVFALNQLAERMAADLSWSSIYLTVVLFLALWWVWYRLAWTTNRYDPARPAIQLMVITPCWAAC